ncbi:fibronectin type III domain-containing protein [Candidatus Uhrbacteria bacterium]|nr:fibronectin type III domain-containing protein [Candidatus Uhrbacteria bacterium]
MKYLLALGVILLVGISAYVWWANQPIVDSTGKLQTELYEGASGVWDPQMEVVAFERSASNTLTLRWQPPQETYNHFLVTISKADGTLLRKESGEHDRVSLDLDGLEAATEYVFTLQACLDSRCEAWLIAQEEYRGTTQPLE